MSKALAVLRTAFLVFIIVFTLVTAPIALWDSATATVTVDAMRKLQRATWIAIAWIAFETLLAWIVLSFRRPRHPQRLPPAQPQGEPPGKAMPPS